jgi:hypothetical protein
MKYIYNNNHTSHNHSVRPIPLHSRRQLQLQLQPYISPAEQYHGFMRKQQVLKRSYHDVQHHHDDINKSHIIPLISKRHKQLLGLPIHNTATKTTVSVPDVSIISRSISISTTTPDDYKHSAVVDVNKSPIKMKGISQHDMNVDVDDDMTSILTIDDTTHDIFRLTYYCDSDDEKKSESDGSDSEDIDIRRNLADRFNDAYADDDESVDGVNNSNDNKSDDYASAENTVSAVNPITPILTNKRLQLSKDTSLTPTTTADTDIQTAHKDINNKKSITGNVNVNATLEEEDKENSSISNNIASRSFTPFVPKRNRIWIPTKNSIA